MHVLFIHQNFPAQFGHIAAHAGVWKATGREIIDWFKTQAG